MLFMSDADIEMAAEIFGSPSRWTPGAPVVIDCGHTRVLDGGELRPSATEVQTAALGIDLARRLLDVGRPAVLSFCLSDLGMTAAGRIALKEQLDRLAARVRELYEAVDVRSIVTLQSQNSNRMANLLHKHRKRLKAMAPEQACVDYGCLFVDTGDRFVMLHPLLGDPAPEIRRLGGNWWLDEHHPLQPIERARAPLADLKRSPAVVLRGESITCPATYAGLILHSRQELGSAGPVDHVAIYSRADDPEIGEKVLAGGLAAAALEPAPGGRLRSVIFQAGSAARELADLPLGRRPSRPGECERLRRLSNELGAHPHCTCGGGPWA